MSLTFVLVYHVLTDNVSLIPCQLWDQAGWVGQALEAATAGLAMTYALNSILALQATIIQSTELEISMNSVERIKY